MTRRPLALLAVPTALLLAGAPGTALAAPAGSAGSAASVAAPVCPAPSRSPDQQARRASAVFTGTVAARHRAGGEVGYAVDVEQVYKGDPGGERVTVTTPARASACGLPTLERGRDYLWFANASGDRLTVDSASGTARATGARIREVARILGKGHPAAPPAPVRATFTRVAGEPTAVARVVAPGVALVIVGLLGFLGAALAGRRRP